MKDQKNSWGYAFQPQVLMLCILLALSALRASSLNMSAQTNAGYIWLNQGTAAANPHTQQIAQQLFHSITQKSGPSDNAWRGLGYAYRNQQREPEALAAWLPIHQQMLDEIDRWAVNSKQARDNQTALEWYERMIALAPHLADGWYFSGELLETEGNLASAQRYYQTGLQTNQFNRVGSGDIALRLGALAYRQEEWLAAIGWFDTALAQADFRLTGRAWEAHYLRAESQRLRHEPALALPDYEQTIRHNPNHYWANVRLAQMRWTVEANFAQAESSLLNAITIDPSRKWAYRILGDLYRENHQTEDALAMYRRVFAIDPQDAIARRYLDEPEQNAD
jgi:tetratricopeptide (TPR) repeat protein